MPADPAEGSIRCTVPRHSFREEWREDSARDGDELLTRVHAWVDDLDREAQRRRVDHLIGNFR